MVGQDADEHDSIVLAVTLGFGGFGEVATYEGGSFFRRTRTRFGGLDDGGEVEVVIALFRQGEYWLW